MSINQRWGWLRGSGLASGLLLGWGLMPMAIGSTQLPSIAQALDEAKLETVTLGTVTATLDPGDKADGICRTKPTLTIVRRGKPLLSGEISNAGNFSADNTIGLCWVLDLTVKDLDGDQEPEVFLSNFSGGAHCCLSELIYRYDLKSQTYQRTEHFWGNGGANLKDLDGDGKPEFESRDDRFAYAFTSYAGSAYPAQIWHYRQGNMLDVTRQHPKVVYNNAFRLWQRLQSIKQEVELPPVTQVNAAPAVTTDDDSEAIASLSPVRATLAAYMADKYTLGQATDGWKRLEQAYPWADRPQFVAELKDFLRETGYITGSFTRRIEFEPDTTYGYGSGRLLPGDRHRYQLNARAGQTLELKLTPQSKVQVQIRTPQGKLLTTLAPSQAKLLKRLPESGDHLLEVTAAAESRYSMWVEIP